MDIGILGPLVVRVDGTSVVPSAAKPRQVLALLAANAGQQMSTATIAQELWGSSPPTNPSGVVQTYIKQLRRAISAALGPVPQEQAAGRSAKDVLRRGHHGYMLDMPGTTTDAHEFDRLATRGLRSLVEGDGEEASRSLERALGLWRGPALADVRTGSGLEVEAQCLEEARRAALDGRITADLQLGRHAQLIGELTMLTARFPLQESLHAQLMVALYRCGRSSQALHVYRRMRAEYVEELGIEPSHRLQRLHRAVLDADPMLDSPVPSLAAF
ncbi:BTAD domain-containing putative transcriptional regulator [Streptomyces ovatisporus]|uniref:BTAD domain-containing putative transcriptional regulator n=1 Tax=Streptomyces ovatisporus TaxID=1128682 RepID=A0ABV9AEV6_9ACTN